MSDISADIGSMSTFSSPAGQPAAPAPEPKPAPTANDIANSPAPGQPATKPASPAAPAPAADDDSKFGEHADYIKQLRTEAADRRVALKPYEDALGSFGEEDRGIWLGLSKEIATALQSQDPKVRAAAAEKLTQLGAHLSGGEQAPPAQQEPAVDQPKYLTQEDFDRMTQERDIRREVEDKVKELGYEPGTADHRELLWLAANQTGYDLDAAHAKIGERNQGIFDSMMEKKRGTPGAKAPKPATTKGATPSQESSIKDWKKSKAALNDFLDQRAAG